jgi:type I restriction enzyme M protein
LIAELEVEKKEFESRDRNEVIEDESAGEEEDAAPKYNYAKDLADELKELNYSIRPSQKRIKTLSGSARAKGSFAAARRAGETTAALEAELQTLKIEISPVERRIEEIETELQPYKEIKEKLTAARRELRQLKNQFIQRLEEARARLTEADSEELVLKLLRENLTTYLDSYITAHRQEVSSAIENLWDKYRVTLGEIELERDEAMREVTGFAIALGYMA